MTCIWCKRPFDDSWNGETGVVCDFRWWRTHWWPTCISCCYFMHGDEGWRHRLAARRYAWWFRRHADDQVRVL